MYSFKSEEQIQTEKAQYEADFLAARAFLNSAAEELATLGLAIVGIEYHQFPEVVGYGRFTRVVTLPAAKGYHASTEVCLASCEEITDAKYIAVLDILKAHVNKLKLVAKQTPSSYGITESKSFLAVARNGNTYRVFVNGDDLPYPFVWVNDTNVAWVYVRDISPQYTYQG